MSLGATLTRPYAAVSELVSLDLQQEEVGFLDFSEADPLVKATERQKLNVRREQTGGMSIVMAHQVPTSSASAPAPGKGFFRKAAQAEVNDLSHR